MNSQNPIRRRDFEKSVIASGVAATFGGVASSNQANAATTEPSPVANGRKQKIKLALIGCGGQGNSLAKRFHQQKDVEVAYVCDPDKARRNKTSAELGGNPKPLGDFRKALDDKSIDAVFIATPDHCTFLHRFWPLMLENTYMLKNLVHIMLPKGVRF